MEDIQRTLFKTLSVAAAQLQAAGLASNLVAQFEKLAQDVYEPCVVAVVGEVKVGKSSFINALLGKDLARVGTTETTATINYFRYGWNPSGKPVRCFWRDGRVEDVNSAFLDNLQARDIDTLRLAEKIDHLEYYLQDDYLERGVTLVDTPGTGTVIEEQHNRTAEYMRLQQQLRSRHSQETEELGSKADAVIYLIGKTPTLDDQSFLEEFRLVSQGQARASNAIGVMSRIDLNSEIVERRTVLAAKYAAQLNRYLNTVVPVSAGIHRALTHFETSRDGLEQMITTLRIIPPSMLDKMLSDEDLYLRPALDCPVKLDTLKELRGEMDWSVFETIARLAANPSLSSEGVREQLHSISGFDRLKDVLEMHIFRRSRLLHCYRIIYDARHLLEEVTFDDLPKLRKNDRQEQIRLSRFLHFIRESTNDPATAEELEQFVIKRIGQHANEVERISNSLARDFGVIFDKLENYNEDFEALHLVAGRIDLFSDDEVKELQALLGLHGLETKDRLLPGKMSVEYVKGRQQAWYRISRFDGNSTRSNVAYQATTRYGFILEEMLGSSI